MWRGGDHDEAELLAGCYWRSLELAHDHALKTVAFPAISTGIYGFPSGAAAQIAVRAVAEALADLDNFAEVTFCCFSASSAALHRAALEMADG